MGGGRSLLAPVFASWRLVGVRGTGSETNYGGQHDLRIELADP